MTESSKEIVENKDGYALLVKDFIERGKSELKAGEVSTGLGRIVIGNTVLTLRQAVESGVLNLEAYVNRFNSDIEGSDVEKISSPWQDWPMEKKEREIFNNFSGRDPSFSTFFQVEYAIPLELRRLTTQKYPQEILLVLKDYIAEANKLGKRVIGF